ncbi:arih1, partial [Symbiodinium sp. KB8]
RVMWLERCVKRDEQFKKVLGTVDGVLSKDEGKQIKLCPNPECRVFDCNNPVNQEWAKASKSQLFDNEGRFDWYRDRYKNHLNSLEFAEKQREEAKLKKRELVDSGLPAVHVQFLLDSVDLVARCRRALAWTYVFAFFIKGPEPRALFQHSQKMLEEHTEKLSGMTEADIDTIRRDRQSILDYSKALHKYLRNIEVY